MIYWRFKIDGTIVEEPYGWDGATFTLERSKVYHGLDNIYTDQFTFTGTGAELIQAEFDSNGVGGSLDFLIEKSCDNSTWETIFEGVINLITFEKINNEITVQIEPSSFERVFKNRLEMPVDLFTSTSVDGDTINTINPVTVRLHSKQIFFETKWDFPELLEDEDWPYEPSEWSGNVNPNKYDEYTIGGAAGNKQYAITINPPFNKYTEEHEKTYTIGMFNTDQRGPTVSDFPTYVGQYFYKNTGNLAAEINVYTRLKFYTQSYSAVTLEDDQTYIYLSVVDENLTQTAEYNLYFRDIKDDPFPSPIPSNGFSVDLTDNRSITVHPNESVYIMISRYGQNTLGGAPESWTIGLAYWFDEANCTLRVTENDKELPSDCKGFYVYEAFSKISSLLTGVNDCFRSDYFSRAVPVMQPVDLEPETDGKGWNNLITQGLLIRNMKQGANDYPFQMSFKELFDAMDCRYNLGMRIEKDGDDYFIRVEPKYYFYESEPNDVSFEYVSDIKETVNTDVIYNVFNSGYQKWQMNIAKINGIDEFNSPRTWKCSNKNANKTLDRVCKFIASGYLIEFTRREQFRKVPTTSFETDTEKFFIALNRVTVTSTKYTDDGTSDTYGLGEVSETLEAFDNVSNVLNPSTCYNLRHTPREMAASWMNFLGITKDEWHVAAEAGNGIIFRRYTEFPSNSDLRYILSAVKDNYYVSLSLIFNTKLIGQLNVEFEVNLTFEQFNQITQNSFKRIAYFCSDIDSDGAEGWISSIKFRPNVDGTAQIKLNKNG